MEVVNYNEVKKMIDNYRANRVNIKYIVTDNQHKKRILSEIFKKEYDNSKISCLKMTLLDEEVILEFKQIKPYKEENIVVLRDDKPMFKAKKGISEELSLYDEEGNLESSLNIEKHHIDTQMPAEQHMDIIKYDLITKTEDKKDYNKTTSIFYNKQNSESALMLNGKIFFEHQPAYKEAYSNTTQLIADYSRQFNDKTKEILNIKEEIVKEYIIKRKK